MLLNEAENRNIEIEEDKVHSPKVTSGDSVSTVWKCQEKSAAEKEQRKVILRAMHGAPHTTTQRT